MTARYALEADHGPRRLAATIPAAEYLDRYVYWSARCREIADKGSESYHAAAYMAARALGRWEGMTTS